jgi:hypothetical protein
MEELQHLRRHVAFGESVPVNVPPKSLLIALKCSTFRAWLNTGVSYQNVLTPWRTLSPCGGRHFAMPAVQGNRACLFA